MVRAIRNTHTPINRLPPEVLSRILEHRDSGQDLVAATHVCQYWRSTLTSSPSLWTCFKFESSRDVDRTVAYLERSKSAIIDIKITLDPLQDPEVLRKFVPHISRTRSFTIRGSRGIRVASSLLLCNPAPSLQHLEMHAREGPVYDLGNFLGQQAPSLRSVTFDGIFPVIESPFPLPNLTEFDLRLLGDADPVRISLLFRLCSNCPRLRKINISCPMFQDVSPEQVTLLESVVELDYTCHTVVRVLPCLKLPRLKRLRVSSPLQQGLVYKLVDLLPHGGLSLLSGATAMLYFSDQSSHTIKLSGRGVNVSLTGFGAAPLHWFSDETRIPFGQIEDLKLEGSYVPTNFPINLFKNVKKFWVSPWSERYVGGFLQLLYPHPETGIPCPSLREIEYSFWSPPGPYTRPLISLVRERERVGHRLELVSISAIGRLDQELEEGLKEHVGELRVRVLGEWT